MQQQMSVEKWDFKTIRQFLDFADVVGDLPIAKSDP
jgi:hypothetical protein